MVITSARQIMIASFFNIFDVKCIDNFPLFLPINVIVTTIIGS